MGDAHGMSRLGGVQRHGGRGTGSFRPMGHPGVPGQVEALELYPLQLGHACNPQPARGLQASSQLHEAPRRPPGILEAKILEKDCIFILMPIHSLPCIAFFCQLPTSSEDLDTAQTVRLCDCVRESKRSVKQKLDDRLAWVWFHMMERPLDLDLVLVMCGFSMADWWKQ
jgi:hypothetical protein